MLVVNITLHALRGLVALVVGISVLHPPDRGGSLRFLAYLGALWAMVLFLAVAVVTDWPSLDATSRILYAALTIFALYIGGRGWSARHRVRHRAPGWQGRNLDDVGFTLISLFAGFVIVSALDLGAPAWLVILIGLCSVFGGRLAIGRVRARWLAEPLSGRPAAARKERSWI